MLIDAQSALVYELFLKTFLWKNDKVINFSNNFFIFSMKMVLKIS